MTLPVNETFTSVQGEGPRTGRLCHFMRFMGCNLSCNWCDTKMTWDGGQYDLKSETTHMSAEQLVEGIPVGVNEVVLTGGEPLMQQKNPEWDRLLQIMRARAMFIAVETNGTIAPTAATQDCVSHYSVSPKLPNVPMLRPKQKRGIAEWPAKLRQGAACLKFVVADPSDVDTAVHMADEHGWPRHSVWVMPEGTDAESLLRHFPDITHKALEYKINVSQRMHIFAFGDARGT